VGAHEDAVGAASELVGSVPECPEGGPACSAHVIDPRNAIVICDVDSAASVHEDAVRAVELIGPGAPGPECDPARPTHVIDPHNAEIMCVGDVDSAAGIHEVPVGKLNWLVPGPLVPNVVQPVPPTPPRQAASRSASRTTPNPRVTKLFTAGLPPAMARLRHSRHK